MNRERADAYASRSARDAIPGGLTRTRAFPSKLRSHVVSRDGGQYLEVEGYASTFNQGYEMWDSYGRYTEVMDEAAFDLSLAKGPDTVFLVNHSGLTMARTIPGPDGRDPSLELRADSTGLAVHGFLNLSRHDVRDFQSALDDGLVTEMSFAFMLLDGRWNPDFDVFRITQADIDRGDVSGVNFGANPHTSIAARAAATGGRSLAMARARAELM